MALAIKANQRIKHQKQDVNDKRNIDCNWIV